MTTAAIIVAAGRGTRAGGEIPKQWQSLAGRPVLAHTLAAFAGHFRLLVIHPDDRARAEDLPADLIVEGGPEADLLTFIYTEREKSVNRQEKRNSPKSGHQCAKLEQS